jgi:hypothetical protein
VTRAVVRGAALICGIAAVLAAAACQNGASDWAKQGASDADLQRALQDCRAQAAALSPMAYDQRTQQIQVDEIDVMQRQTTCMLVGGWRLTPRQ